MRYLFLLAAITLSGCGQKGALYLPKDAPKPAQAQVETTTEGQPQG
ncbi:hypothetical protein NBRC116188_13270 [Oceaniserpentilla sp. 4NH20-0058]